jgi:LEA14-like dessication related protein
MSDRRRALVTLIALTALAGAGCSSLNQRFDPPTVTLESLRILRIVDARADLRIGLRVFNPNPFVLAVSRVDVDVLIDGRTAASSRSTQITTLPAQGDAPMELSGRVDVAAVATAMMTLASQVPIDYAVSGLISLSDGTRVPFSRKGRVPPTRVDRNFGPRPQ